ncbi:unnamed protein product, partial [Ectocarpus sp. 6 AP-2014]
MYSSGHHAAMGPPSRRQHQHQRQRQQQPSDTSSADEMDTSPDISPRSGDGLGGAKRWPPAEEHGGAAAGVFENGEYLPSAMDTTQPCYHAVCDRDKLGVRYRGQGHHEQDWGTVRANHPLPRHQRVWYFEATIAAQGENCCITLGLIPASFPVNRQPGTEGGSYGLEGNGKVFSGSGVGQTFGTPFCTGDTVGLGVNFKKMEVFLTHNGRLLGAAFPAIRCALDVHGLYPCVGLHSRGEAVHLNFGRRPYLFDVSASVAGEDYREQAAVAAVPVCPVLLRSLVRDYLLHQGCEKTLKSLDEADEGGAAKVTAAATAGSKAGKASDAAAAAAAASASAEPPPPPLPALAAGASSFSSSASSARNAAAPAARKAAGSPPSPPPAPNGGGSTAAAAAAGV